MTRARLVVGLFAILVAYSTAGCALGASHTVLFSVTGSVSGMVATIEVTSFGAAGGNPHDTLPNTPLPYSLTKTMSPGADVYLKATNTPGGGCVTVEIDVDGKAFSGPSTECTAGLITRWALGTLH